MFCSLLSFLTVLVLLSLDALDLKTPTPPSSLKPLTPTAVK